MAVGVSSGNVTASVLNTSASVKQVKSFAGAITANATTTIGTCGAGKIWRIIGMEISVRTGAATENADIRLNDVVVMYNVTSGTAGAIAYAPSRWQGSYDNSFPVAATQTIKINASANANGFYNIMYVEETA